MTPPAQCQNLPTVLLENGRLLDLETDKIRIVHLLIKNSIIRRIQATPITDFAGTRINLEQGLIVPGLIDMHVHFREPGFEHKEDLLSGAASAMAGGFTTVCTMPNTNPAIDNPEQIRAVYQKMADHPVQILPIAAITRGRAGTEAVDFEPLRQAGAIGFSDDGSFVPDSRVLRRALQISAQNNFPIIEHCEDPLLAGKGVMHAGKVSQALGLPGIPGIAEDIIVARDLILAEETGGHLHVAHISTARSVELVRRAKEQGVNITCEVAPHHFTLTDDAIKQLGAEAKMNPPLRTQADVDAIKAGLADGTIDVIASDHAPHTDFEKAAGMQQAPFGIVGLETMLGLTLTHLVKTNIISLSTAIRKMTLHPARILSLELPTIRTGIRANLTIFDPDGKRKIDRNKFLSKSCNTPFDGWTVHGKIFGIYNRGKFWRAG